MGRWFKIIACLFLALLMNSCSLKIVEDIYTGCSYNEIRFDIDKLDTNGRHIRTKQILTYEFCIPDNETTWKEVLTINPELKKTSSKGRSSCGTQKVLVLGNTDNKAFKTMLCKIANLDYVKRVSQTHWE